MTEQKYNEIIEPLTNVFDLISGSILPNPPSFKSDKISYKDGIDIYDSNDDGEIYTCVQCKIDFVNDSYRFFCEMQSEYEDDININCVSNSFDKFIELLKENDITETVKEYF